MKAYAAIFALLAVAAPAGAARADDLEGLLEQEVVSTVSKAPETASDAPATSTIITAEDLRRHGIRTLDEALNFLSMGVVVENNIHDFEIGVRGVHFPADYGDHVLLLVNGHAMNEQWGGTAYYERGTGIPFELVDHIEVILGPGSVLYGSNAMLAVINIVTKRAKDWDGVHAVVESEVPVTFRALAGVGHRFKLFGRPSEVTAAVEYFTQSGPDFTFAPERVTPQRLTFFGPKTTTWGGVASRDDYTELPTAYVRLLVGDLEVNVRAESWKRGSPTNLDVFDDPTNYEVDRWLTGDVKYRAVLSPSVDLTSRLYADSYDYRESYPSADPIGCVGGMPLGCYYELVGIARWTGLEEQLSVDWTHDGRLYTLVGVDGRLRQIGSKTDYFEVVTNRNPGSFGQYDLGEEALGAYVEQIAAPWKALTLNAGLRIDVDSRIAGGHASPRAAVTLPPGDGAALKAIYAEAFRAPSAYERYYVDPGGHAPAPDLQPEIVRSGELVFDQRVKSQHAIFGVFRTEFSDLVLEETLTPQEVQAFKAQGVLDANVRHAAQFQNVESLSAEGFNAGLEGTLLDARLRYGATFTAAFARTRTSFELVFPITGQPLDVSPEVSGNARVSYDLGGAWPTLAVAGRFVGARPASGAFDGGYAQIPYAPLLVETRFAVSGKVPFVAGLSYRGTVNLVSTTEAPYPVGPGYLANGNAELSPLDPVRFGVGLFYDRGL
ncbi:MAG TPA: TonB-dependent receptor [Minicystis sp.]|nr:TonB-dependent receptor [Minicystis sp.]